MIGRVVHEADLQARGIGERSHAVQELAPVSVTLGSVVHVDDDPFDLGEVRLAQLPPGLQSVDHEVAGLVAGGEEQERLPGHDLQDPAWNQLLLRPHVMVEGGDRFLAAGPATARVAAQVDDRLGVHADTDSLRIAVGLCVHAVHVLEDRVRPRRFFWTTVLATVRSR
jgi:hypothetical protein